MNATLTPNERVDELLDVIDTVDTEPIELSSCRMGGRLEALRWHMARYTGMAIVAVDPDEIRINVDMQRRENRQRDLMTEEVTRRVAIAMDDAVYMFERRRLAGRNVSDRHFHFALMDARLSYPELRDYLAFDCRAAYLTVCAVLFELRERKLWQRLIRDDDRFERDRERGWI